MSSVRISEVLGNSQRLDGGAMFGNAPRPLWQRWMTPDELGRIPLACRALLIEIDDQKLLFEAGIGAFFEPKLAERFGVQDPDRHVLLHSLNNLGLTQDDIDYVILSHLHFDHAGGLLPTHQELQDGNDQLLFPKAQYIVGAEALARAEKPHFRDRASFLPDLNQKLKDSGRLKIVHGTHCPGVFEERLSFFISNGHTPGQMHSIFRGDESTVVFAGDLIPGTHWVHLPITMGYDRYPEKVIDEKAQFYRQAVPENWWVFYTHDPTVACSQIAQNDQGKYHVTKAVESPRQMVI